MSSRGRGRRARLFRALGHSRMAHDTLVASRIANHVVTASGRRTRGQLWRVLTCSRWCRLLMTMLGKSRTEHHSPRQESTGTQRRWWQPRIDEQVGETRRVVQCIAAPGDLCSWAGVERGR